jgi:hypothetical protein
VDELVDEVLAMLEIFRTQIENAVALSTYRAMPSCIAQQDVASP